MIKKLSRSSGNIVGYKAIGTITVPDFLKLEPEIEALMRKEGNIRMLIDLSEFKFGSEFHHEVQKMAIVGDKTWEKLITHLAKPFYAHDAKFFHSADIDKAWAWLRE